MNNVAPTFMAAFLYLGAAYFIGLALMLIGTVFVVYDILVNSNPAVY